jgi:hypothetical protein
VNSRRTPAVLLGCFLVAALIATYIVFWSRASTDLEPNAVSGSGLENRTTELATSTARKPASPASAESTLVAANDAGPAFEKLRLCTYASRELAVTNSLSDCKQYEGRTDFQDLYAQCLNGWMNVPNRKTAAEATRKDAGCGDTTDVATRYFEATKLAARAGDADAQMCYLQGEFSTSNGKPIFTDAEVEEYGRVAPQYVDAALQRGDWRIVELMTKDSFHPGVEPIRQIPNVGKPETIYKMRKLLRLGASGSYAKSLDMDLDGMIHPDLVPEAALPADAVKTGDSWAQQTFNENFSGVAGLTERPTVCMALIGNIDRLPGPTTTIP